MLDDTKEEREAAQRKVQEEKLRKKLADAEAAAELKARLAEAAGRRSTHPPQRAAAPRTSCTRRWRQRALCAPANPCP